MTDICLDGCCNMSSCRDCLYAEDNDYPGALIRFVNMLVEDSYMTKESALQFMLENK